jgi:hypothetical protein
MSGLRWDLATLLLRNLTASCAEEQQDVQEGCRAAVRSDPVRAGHRGEQRPAGRLRVKSLGRRGSLREERRFKSRVAARRERNTGQLVNGMPGALEPKGRYAFCGHTLKDTETS